jgi:hypothetical protein
VKEAADLLRARPILSSLLAQKTITDEEKDAILDFLGGAGTLDDEAIQNASKLAENEGAVLDALMDMQQQHAVKPPEETPKQPVSEPQSPAGTDTVTGLIQKMIG